MTTENFGNSDTGGDWQKCHCSRISQYPTIFKLIRSFFSGTKRTHPAPELPSSAKMKIWATWNIHLAYSTGALVALRLPSPRCG